MFKLACQCGNSISTVFFLAKFHQVLAFQSNCVSNIIPIEVFLYQKFKLVRSEYLFQTYPWLRVVS